MKLPIYQVDAFASQLFSGNPAAIVLAPSNLSETQMQAIAAENNLSETAFIFKSVTSKGTQGNGYEGTRYQIRWFTPTTEVDLCGHATLAAAHVIFNHLNSNDGLEVEATPPTITFSSKSGPLHVCKEGDILWLNFPTDTLKPVDIMPDFPGSGVSSDVGNDNVGNDIVDHIAEGLGSVPVELYRGRDDYLVILSRESTIAALNPKMSLLSQIPARGIIVSAPGQVADFVSRFFAPQSGIPEDPVTGSAHTTLIPYWSQKLNKMDLKAKQLSQRGGELVCKNLGQRVEIGGQAQTYLVGEIAY